MQTSPSASAPQLLSHERLDAYRVAVTLDALVVDISRRAPRGQSWLVDQFQRASGSAVLNLVEGDGRRGADRDQHFRIARGSALEVDGALVLMGARRLATQQERTQGHERAMRLVSMLTAMTRRGGGR
jgi:four helix bundle protein